MRPTLDGAQRKLMKMPSLTHNLPSGTGREVLQAGSSMPSVRFENEYPHRFTAYSLVPQKVALFQEVVGPSWGKGRGPWNVISSPWFLTLSPLPGPLRRDSSHHRLSCFAMPSLTLRDWYPWNQHPSFISVFHPHQFKNYTMSPKP